MRMMCLQYRVIYFKHIPCTVVITTHGYVIIPKPNCSSRETINSHCRRLDSICRRNVMTAIAAVSLAVQPNTRFVRSFVGYFVHKKSARGQIRCELVTVDTNSFRHVPRRSSKNCDLQFSNNDTDSMRIIA